MAKSGETKSRRSTRRTDEGGRTSTIASTDVQNALGDVLRRVSGGERVFVTRYGRREAVILSTGDYAELIGEEKVDLEALEQRFNTMMERMQTPEQAAAIDALFDLSSEDLGEAAVEQAGRERESESGT